MIRRFALLLAVVALVPRSSAADFEDIKRRGTLRVIVAADEQPEMFSLQASGAPGFDRELLEGFASLHRIRVEPLVLPFDEGIPALLAGKGDVIIELIDTEARRRRLAFTAPILPVRTIVVTRKPEPPIATLEALRAARIGVVEGTSWVDAATAAGVPASRLETLPDLSAALAAVKTKRVQGTVLSLVDATLAIRKDPELQAGITLDDTRHASYGVRPADAQLLQALNDYIAGMRKAGTWSRLVVKYFGDRALTILGHAE
jgi:ABC-type amino acid transport substrate-binding protein